MSFLFHWSFFLDKLNPYGQKQIFKIPLTLSKRYTVTVISIWDPLGLQETNPIVLGQ